jgi:hypothetical protein
MPRRNATPAHRLPAHRERPPITVGEIVRNIRTTGVLLDRTTARPEDVAAMDRFCGLLWGNPVYGGVDAERVCRAVRRFARDAERGLAGDPELTLLEILKMDFVRFAKALVEMERPPLTVLELARALEQKTPIRVNPRHATATARAIDRLNTHLRAEHGEFAPRGLWLAAGRLARSRRKEVSALEGMTVIEFAEGLLGPDGPSGRRGRPCYERDHTWLRWKDQEHMTPKAIRTRWNAANPHSKVSAAVVKAGLRTARREANRQ